MGPKDLYTPLVFFLVFSEAASPPASSRPLSLSPSPSSSFMMSLQGAPSRHWPKGAAWSSTVSLPAPCCGHWRTWLRCAGQMGFLLLKPRIHWHTHTSLDSGGVQGQSRLPMGTGLPGRGKEGPRPSHPALLPDALIRVGHPPSQGGERPGACGGGHSRSQEEVSFAPPTLSNGPSPPAGW